MNQSSDNNKLAIAKIIAHTVIICAFILGIVIAHVSVITLALLAVLALYIFSIYGVHDND